MSADIQQAFAEQLRAAGLIVKQVEMDGSLHRCGTEGRPHRRDGAYKAFPDVPASLWWKNWRTGDEGSWCGKSGKDMTTAEREALKARIAEAKEAAAKEQAERYAKATELAGKLWEAAHAATDAHPYLARKEVPPFGLKQAQDGRLMVPVLDAAGTPQSLQFIDADGEKRFLSGGRTAGGYFSLPARDGSKDCRRLRHGRIPPSRYGLCRAGGLQYRKPAHRGAHGAEAIPRPGNHPVRRQ